MTTYVRTTKARYEVQDVFLEDSGKAVILVRQPSGKTRKLYRKDVGTSRFNAATIHFFTAKHKEA